MGEIKACIFDLDGVVVDTAKYHYLAWRRLAHEFGFEFHEKDNERLKGVSRMDSLNILLQIGGIKLDQDEKNALASKKNQWYLEYIYQMKPDEVLPGVKKFIEELRSIDIKVGLGSASKNANLILTQVEMAHLFDVVIDGSMVKNAKPDPEIFLLGAQRLNVNPQECLIFEDAEAGIEAAIKGCMRCIGVGDPVILGKANAVIPNFKEMNVVTLYDILKQ